MPNKEYYKRSKKWRFITDNLISASFPLIIWIYYVIYVPHSMDTTIKDISISLKIFWSFFVFSLPFIIIAWNFFSAQYQQ